MAYSPKYISEMINTNRITRSILPLDLYRRGGAERDTVRDRERV